MFAFRYNNKLSTMRFQLYSQLLRLDLANDHLLEMYYTIYYDIPKEDEEMLEKMNRLIEVREKIKMQLRGHLFYVKNEIEQTRIAGTVIDYLRDFIKLEYLARHAFVGAEWKKCYEKERQNIRLFYETLYSQEIPTSTLDVLLRRNGNLESLPK